MQTRLRVRPTSRGWQALVIGIIVLFVARLIGTTQLHQLAYALLALVLAALVLGYFAARGLKFARSLPVARFSAGTPARIDLLISSDSTLNTSGIEVVDRLPELRSFESPPLGKGGGASVEVPVTFPKRGLYNLGPAEVQAFDPFGMLRFSREFSERTEVVVYPPIHDLTSFPTQGGAVEAGARGARGQRGDEFAGLREYRRGDDMRHIHWKSVARTGELFVKEFALQAPLRYTVALDLRRRGLRTGEAEVEDAVSAAASILHFLKKNRLPARLLLTDRESRTSGAATEFSVDEKSYWRAMRTLATVKADGDTEIGAAMAEERGNLGEGVMLVARGAGEGREDLFEGVRRLRRAGLSVAVVAVAAHTYRGYPPDSPAFTEKEAALSRDVYRLEQAGAAVLVLRRSQGVAGILQSGSRQGSVV